MFGPLWRREFRGARRRWWRQPWVVPLAVAVGVLGPLAPPFLSTSEWIRQWDVTAGLPRFETATIWVSQAALALWMIWVVAVAFTRERAPGMGEQLALTALTPRQIILSKTFAATWPALLLIVGLALAENWFLRWMSIVEHLGRLGHALWSAHMMLSSIWTGPEAIRTYLTHGDHSAQVLWLLFRIELPLRTFVEGLALITLTAWISTRAKTAWTALLTTLGILLALWGSAFVCDWLVYGHLIEWESFFRGVGQGNWQRRRMIRLFGELVYDWTARLLIPSLWLVYWWRWTKRGWIV